MILLSLWMKLQPAGGTGAANEAIRRPVVPRLEGARDIAMAGAQLQGGFGSGGRRGNGSEAGRGEAEAEISRHAEEHLPTRDHVRHQGCHDLTAKGESTLCVMLIVAFTCRLNQFWAAQLRYVYQWLTLCRNYRRRL